MAGASSEDQGKKIDHQYELIGRIAVHAEHINVAMEAACLVVLRVAGMPREYAQILLAGQNIEKRRNIWTAIMKEHCKGQPRQLDAIDWLSNRIDSANRRRNDVIHRNWWIGGDNPDIARGDKVVLDRKLGGVIAKEADSRGFKDLLFDIELLSDQVTALLSAVMIGKDACASLQDALAAKVKAHALEDAYVKFQQEERELPPEERGKRPIEVTARYIIPTIDIPVRNSAADSKMKKKPSSERKVETAERRGQSSEDANE